MYPDTKITWIYDEMHGTYSFYFDSVEHEEWHFLYMHNLETTYNYILPNAEETHEYELPSIYYCLIKAMRLSGEEAVCDAEINNGKSLPDIPVSIEYYDLQGVKYLEEVVIRTNTLDALGVGEIRCMVSMIPN